MNYYQKLLVYHFFCRFERYLCYRYSWEIQLTKWTLILQILEWLSNMPVDLEGYIRSGCTILTLFVAMPQQMWDNVL